MSGSLGRMRTEVPTGAVPAAYANRLPLLAHKLGMLVLKLAEPRLAELDLTGRHYAALAVLADDRPGSQSELAGTLGLVPGLVVAVLDELEARGLAERRRSATDRRRTVVGLTDAGSELLARADAVSRGVEDELARGFSAEERDELRALLGRAVANTWAACGGAD